MLSREQHLLIEQSSAELFLLDHLEELCAVTLVRRDVVKSVDQRVKGLVDLNGLVGHIAVSCAHQLMCFLRRGFHEFHLRLAVLDLQLEDLDKGVQIVAKGACSVGHTQGEVGLLRHFLRGRHAEARGETPRTGVRGEKRASQPGVSDRPFGGSGALISLAGSRVGTTPGNAVEHLLRGRHAEARGETPRTGVRAEKSTNQPGVSDRPNLAARALFAEGLRIGTTPGNTNLAREELESLARETNVLGRVAIHATAKEPEKRARAQL